MKKFISHIIFSILFFSIPSKRQVHLVPASQTIGFDLGLVYFKHITCKAVNNGKNKPLCSLYTIFFPLCIACLEEQM